MTPFKAVDGYVKPNEVYRYGVMDDDALMVQASPLARTDQPCTIIPGHWAERIESGELLTEEEMQEIHNEWVLAGGVSWSVFLCRFIARKLRGEA